MLHFTNIGPVVLFWHLARRLYLNYGHLILSQADFVNGRMSGFYQAEVVRQMAEGKS